MTEAEKLAVEKLADAWNAMIACDAAGVEAMAHLHALQHAVMARATVRAHPELFRPLLHGKHDLR